jgi:hypothetical protein
MGEQERAKGTSTVSCARLSSPPDLSRYGADVERWPRSWMGVDKDLLPGEKMVAYFRPFLEYLVQSNLSRKTIRKHAINLWVLGGEIIRDLNLTPSLRKRPVEQLVFKVAENGGCLLYHCDSEEEQRSFDSTCRKLYRFLKQTAR